LEVEARWSSASEHEAVVSKGGSSNLPQLRLEEDRRYHRKRASSLGIPLLIISSGAPLDPSRCGAVGKRGDRLLKLMQQSKELLLLVHHELLELEVAGGTGGGGCSEPRDLLLRVILDFREHASLVSCRVPDLLLERLEFLSDVGDLLD